jgi:hypothetical protein
MSCGADSRKPSKAETIYALVPMQVFVYEFCRLFVSICVSPWKRRKLLNISI